MRIGTLLTAIDPCPDKYSGQPYLTIGKEYKVISHRGRFFYIISDDGREHSFGIPHYETYFQSITPESLEELGFERYGDLAWRLKGDSGVKVVVLNCETVRAYFLDNVIAFTNCRTLTDLKHLIRILGV